MVSHNYAISVGKRNCGPIFVCVVIKTEVRPAGIFANTVWKWGFALPRNLNCCWYSKRGKTGGGGSFSDQSFVSAAHSYYICHALIRTTLLISLGLASILLCLCFEHKMFAFGVLYQQPKFPLSNELFWNCKYINWFCVLMCVCVCAYLCLLQNINGFK